MKETLFIIRYRGWIVAFAFVLLVVLIVPLLNTRVNSNLETYFPDSLESKINLDRIEKIFGSSEPVILVLETKDVLNDTTLTRIESLAAAFGKKKEIRKVISLFEVKNIKGENGMMIVDPAVPRIPQTREDREILRDELRQNDLACGLVVSRDFHDALLLLYPVEDVEDHVLTDLIFSALEEYPGNEKVMVFGQPYLRVEANQKLGTDIMILLPIGVVVMFFFLLASFREPRGVLLPMSVVIFSIVLSLAVIPLMGWELSIIGILLPVMMIAIANNYGVHFIIRYRELIGKYPDLDVNDVIAGSYRYLKKPVVLTGLTTIAGILGLVAHVMYPARQMGIASALGVGFALLLSLTWIPAVLSFLKKSKVREKGNGTPGMLANLLTKISIYTSLNPKPMVLIFLLVFLIMVSGLFRFRIASDFNNILPERHPFSQAIRSIDRHFGGTKTVQIMVEGDIKDPVILKKTEMYEKELKKLPEAGSVTSIATVIRKMSRALNDPSDVFYDAIPDNRQAVAQYLELYSMSGDPEDFENFVDFDYKKALIMVQYRAGSMALMNRVTETIKSLTQNDPNVTVIAGYSLFEKELCEAIVTGQYQSLLFAFVAILILLSVIFKSVKAGIMGSLPLVVAVLATFGIMGWLGIKLDIVSALLSSVSIGLGVDYTIHMFWRLKSELTTCTDYRAAAATAIQTIGKGITINAFSVMAGFSVLLFSSFPLIRNFGFLIIFSLLICLLCALLLIPALCILLQPEFFLRKKFVPMNEGIKYNPEYTSSPPGKRPIYNHKRKILLNTDSTTIENN